MMNNTLPKVCGLLFGCFHTFALSHVPVAFSPFRAFAIKSLPCFRV